MIYYFIIIQYNIMVKKYPLTVTFVYINLFQTPQGTVAFMFLLKENGVCLLTDLVHY